MDMTNVNESGSVILQPNENRHLSLSELASGLHDELQSLSESMGTELELVRLGDDKKGIDSTTKALIQDNQGGPIGVVVCSRPASPDQVARGVARAELARTVVGPRAGSVIIEPLRTGTLDGRSFAILPWGRELPSSKIGWAVARRRYRRPVLNWLHEAVQNSATYHRGRTDSSSEGFADALHHLRSQSFLPSDVESAVSRSIHRLEDRAWHATHCFDHNDFWHGNLLLREPKEKRKKYPYPFVLIDWAGANVTGFGIYDLIRISRSFRMTPIGLRRELTRHSVALGCELDDLSGHLLAGMGHLHQNLEHFPLERFKEAFRTCWQSFSQAMASDG